MKERTQEPLNGDTIVSRHDIIHDALALLKVQEPMQIIKVGYYDHGKCPKCDRYVSRYSNFCWYCGQAVKWE